MCSDEPNVLLLDSYRPRLAFPPASEKLGLKGCIAYGESIVGTPCSDPNCTGLMAGAYREDSALAFLEAGHPLTVIDVDYDKEKHACVWHREYNPILPGAALVADAPVWSHRRITLVAQDLIVRCNNETRIILSDEAPSAGKQPAYPLPDTSVKEPRHDSIPPYSDFNGEETLSASLN
ncbi:MAG: hypothetical protein ABSF55_01195 [Candidatus Staskawiczbacteria bacterium]|jgi:hypothetical protein